MKRLLSVFSPEVGTQRQFRTAMTLNLAILICVILVSATVYTRIILQRNEAYTGRIIQQYRTSVVSQSEEFQKFVQTVAYDTTVTRYLLEEDPYLRHLFSRQVNNLFSNMKMVQSKALEIFLFRPDEAEDTFASIASSQGEIVPQLWLSSSAAVLDVYPLHTAQSTTPALIVGCSIFDTTQNDIETTPVGAIAVAFSLDEMESALRGLADLSGISYAVFSRSQQWIAGNLQAGQSPLLDQALALANRQEAGTVSSPLHSITVIPTGELNGSLLIHIDLVTMLKDLFTITILVTLLAVFFTLLTGLLFRNLRMQITVPLGRVTAAIEEMEHDRSVERRVPVIGNKDIRTLSLTLNQMLDTERKLTGELLDANTHLYEAKLSQNRMELQFLRSQINPHFLYNTLETIRSIAMVRGVSEVASTAKSLATILRYSIKGNETVPLREEIAIIEHYLSIQQTRFRDRFEVEILLDERAGDISVPGMCLQPLVENAVVHGLESLLRKGRLTINCRVERDALEISISDDGNGISQDALARINGQLKQPMLINADESKSIGLINVARRLHIMRGGNFRMWVESRPDQGTRVMLYLPLHQEG